MPAFCQTEAAASSAKLCRLALFPGHKRRYVFLPIPPRQAGSNPSRVRSRDGHSRQGGLPHQGDLGGGEGVGLVDEVAEGALKGQGLGCECAGGGEGAGVFIAQGLEAGGG